MLKAKLFNDQNLIVGLEMKNDVIFRCVMGVFDGFFREKGLGIRFFREIRGLSLVWEGEVAKVKFHDIS